MKKILIKLLISSGAVIIVSEIIIVTYTIIDFIIIKKLYDSSTMHNALVISFVLVQSIIYIFVRLRRRRVRTAPSPVFNSLTFKIYSTVFFMAAMFLPVAAAVYLIKNNSLFGLAIGQMPPLMPIWISGITAITGWEIMFAELRHAELRKHEISS